MSTITESTTPVVAKVEEQSLRSLAAMVAAHVHDGAPESVIADWWSRMAVAKRRMREIDQLFREGLLEWLDKHGDLEIGDVRVYAGTSKREKVRDLAAAIDSALTEVGGDVDRLVELLSANALKPGACGSMLGDDWRAEHFETEVVMEPKTGKPKREPKSLNTKFLPVEKK